MARSGDYPSTFLTPPYHLHAAPAACMPLLVAVVLFLSSLSNAQTLVPKQGGVYFRVDDDHLAWQYRQYDSLFTKHGVTYSLAVNVGRPCLTSEEIAFLQGAQSRGNQIMDHTPYHFTQFFRYVVDTAFYSGRAGVDHINGDKVCLAYAPVDTTGSVGSGFADIAHDLVTSRENGAFKNVRPGVATQIFFPTLSKLCDISSTGVENGDSANVDSIRILTAWDEPIDLGVQENVDYVILGLTGGRFTDDALRLLVERSLLLFSQAGLNPPVCWIQPGGLVPNLNRRDVERIFGREYQFRSGATYWDRSVKVYNEYDPEFNKRFSMEWGDFHEDYQSLETIKSTIADRVAKHYVSVGESHFSAEDWTVYLTLIDSLLSWLVESGIPVRTQVEWADILYGSTPDPYENIIPPLHVDLDANGVPDGYAGIAGVVDRTDGPPGGEGTSLSTDRFGTFCSIGNLGGLEKGENEFSLWIKGPVGSSVRAYFGNFSDRLYEPIQVTFTVINSDWTKYTLNDATSGPASITIPSDVSTCSLYLVCDDNKGGTVKISGMEMRKAGGPLPVTLASFTARPNPHGPGVLLEWTTVSEINNYGFFVQCRLDGLQAFQDVSNSFVPGHGTTIEPKYYCYPHSIDVAGEYEYRLRQVDLDGTVHYTQVTPFALSQCGLAEERPTEFSISQNYPNPFNPSTTIRYALPLRSHVTLLAFNTLGQQVAALTMGEQEAGHHEVRFDGSGLSSGMYIYRLQAGGHVSTKTMALIK